MFKLGIIGIGKMGSSILDGAVKANLFSPKDVAIYTTNLDHRKKYSQEGYNILENEASLFSNSQIILLAVKPQVYEEVLKYANGIDFSDKCIISLAPGISISYLERYFNNATIVRAMPNTPAILKLSATTLCKNKDNDLSKKAIALFDQIGYQCELEEKYIDEAIPINGSMPAYLYSFAKEFINNGVSRGLDYENAKILCAKSIIGSAQMLLDSKDSIDTLINNVCSKKGTTIEGLEALYNNDFKKSIDKCYEACVNRSKELAKK